MYHSYHSIDKLDKPTGELFLVNPRNEAFAYGQVDRPARDATTGCALLFLVPFVLAGVLVASWTIVQWRDWVVLTYSGANVTGYITDRSISESDDPTWPRFPPASARTTIWRRATDRRSSGGELA